MCCFLLLFHLFLFVIKRLQWMNLVPGIVICFVLVSITDIWRMKHDFTMIKWEKRQIDGKAVALLCGHVKPGLRNCWDHMIQSVSSHFPFPPPPHTLHSFHRPSVCLNYFGNKRLLASWLGFFFVMKRPETSQKWQHLLLLTFRR